MAIEKILTRNRKLEDFDKKKIRIAIEKAAFSVNVEISKIMLIRIVNNLVRHLDSKFKSEIVYVEDVQNLIEEELFRSGYFKVAKSFIAYRERHRLLRDDSNAYVDAISSVSEYVDISDWRINENANQSYSIGGMILNTSGKITANYWLKHVYSPEIGRAHSNADFHIHDLSMLTGYCAGWSLKSFLNEGFNGVPNKVESKPPKHFMSALSQMVNFLGTMQNEWAGAQAFSSFDTYLAPYVYKDKLSYDEVKQNIQQFIFNLNIPSRWGSQTPFTNLTLDWVVPKDLKEQVPLVNSEPLIKDEPNLKYKDFTKEMAMINRAFLEVMTEGDAKGRVFTFPIPTYNITEDFDWYGENTDLLFEVTAKYGLPYFQNFIGSQYIIDENGKKVSNSRAYKPDAVRSMCCRLQLDLNELLKRGNGLFGSAEMTGSIGVVTINAARLGYRFKGDKEGLFNETLRLMILAKESLETKRKVINKNMKKGLYPFTKRYLGHLRNHFSTIGINGINEMVRNFTDDSESLINLKGLEFAKEYLEFIRSHMKTFQEETGNMYNLEATPAEGTTYRFAKEDKKKYPDILQAGFGENIYYTNSSQLPVNYTDDPFEVLDFQDELQCKYTGGTVQHIYIGERLNNADVCRKMVKKVISNYRLPYITITPTFSLCQTHGYIRGEHEFCPKCDEILLQKGENINSIDNELRSVCEIWTRVMGYYRPVSQWNLGKKGEHMERVYFKSDITEAEDIKKDEGIAQI